MKTNIKKLSEEELIRFVKELGQKHYRARQIINWIYKKLVTSFEEMTDLSKGLREELKNRAFISKLKLIEKRVSKDGTQKFLFGLEDGETIESVLIPNSRDKDRLTLCISSQIGCARGCRLCKTGMLGLRRNLKAYEIIDQVMAVTSGVRDRDNITNIVLMGMGEPLDNFDEVIEALWRMTGLMGFSRRRITLSTAGVVPKIMPLAHKGPAINLAISLNATTDEVRNKLMPINKKYPLSNLLSICRKFPLPPRRRITFEYVLLRGINDSEEDAIRFVRLLKGIKSKVNLIPYNPILETISAPSFKHFEQVKQFSRPSDDKILKFQKVLLKAGLTATIRKSKGVDISAACGQLRASYLFKN